MLRGVDDDSLRSMEADISLLPDDIEALKALLVSALQRADVAEAKLANTVAQQSATEALFAHRKLQIAKLKREQYGPSAERSRLLDQMELQLEELEADAAEDDLIAEEAAAKTTTVTAFERKRPARKRFPGSSTARACLGACALLLPGVRRGSPFEARGGRHRDPLDHPALLKGDPDGAREVLVPGLREDRASTGTLSRCSARMGRAQLHRHATLREVWAAPTA